MAPIAPPPAIAIGKYAFPNLFSIQCAKRKRALSLCTPPVGGVVVGGLAGVGEPLVGRVGGRPFEPVPGGGGAVNAMPSYRVAHAGTLHESGQPVAVHGY